MSKRSNATEGVGIPPPKSAKVTPPSSDAGGAHVPVVKPAATEPPAVPYGVVSRLPMPTMPKGNVALTCDIVQLMRDIMAWCRQELPHAMAKSSAALQRQFGGKPMWECAPLQIKEGGDGILVGHKEPFCKGKCCIALKETGMYEAGMNIDWLRTHPTNLEERRLLGDVPSLADLEYCRGSWFDVSDEDLAPPQVNSERRYSKVFPVVLAAYADREEMLQRDFFPQSIVLLDGHIYVWAWWLHAYNLLSLGWEDGSWPPAHAAAFRQHIDCALSVTVHLRVMASTAALAKWSISRAAERQVTATRVTDSFVAFIQKAELYLREIDVKKRCQTLFSSGVGYNGESVNRTMYFAFQACLPILEPNVFTVVQQLQREFGKECLTRGYSKLYQLSRLCDKVANSTNVDIKDLLAHVFRGLLFELRMEILTTDNMTVPKLTCTRGGNSGKVGVLLWKYILIHDLLSLAQDTAKDNSAFAKEVECLTNDFGSYPAFEEKFQKCLASSQADAIETWKKDKRKAITDSADFLHDLYGGLHDTILAAINIEECKEPVKFEWASVRGFKAYEDVVRQYRTPAIAVSSPAAEEEAPKLGKRCLTRLKSDPTYEDAKDAELVKERNEVWRRAAAERKAYCTFSVCKQWTTQNLAKHVASLVAANDFKGIVGERHRLHFGSCDLIGNDVTTEPWKNGVMFCDEMTSMATAMLQWQGACDIAVAFDGGSTSVRRKMEEAFDEAKWRCLRQISVVYDTTGGADVRSWKRVFGSANLETGLFATRFRSNKWRVQRREKFGIGPKGSSASSVFASVPSRSLASLPTMKPGDRLLMTGSCPIPAAGIYDVETRGHPFSWNERKPMSWYEAFLTETCTGLVIDYSPGSGCMARACLNKGIQYVGICRTDQHCSWLNNILNRAAVECISRNASPLYNQDLSTCIKDHFKELIEELHQQDAAVSMEFEDPNDSESE